MDTSYSKLNCIQEMPCQLQVWSVWVVYDPLKIELHLLSGEPMLASQ